MTQKNIRICVAGLLALQMLWFEASRAQTQGGAADSSPFSKEISKQESIYQSKGGQVPAGYSIDRSLADYTRGLASEFGRELENLGPKDRWLDVGAGQGQAILDYYAPGDDATHPEGHEQRNKKAKAVAMSIEDRRTPAWYQAASSPEANPIQYLFGRRLGEYSLAELGKFQVITDMLGGFSYTQNLSRFMENALGYLEVGGSFYSVLQDVRTESGINRPHYPDSRFLTEILNADASEVKVCSWLKSITCVQVSCEPRADWTPPIEAYRIHKICDKVMVPELVPVHFEAGTPPERRFQLRRPLPVSVEQGSTAR